MSELEPDMARLQMVDGPVDESMRDVTCLEQELTGAWTQEVMIQRCCKHL